MDAITTTPVGVAFMLGSDPVPRRRQAWGMLWSKAPWDGKPISPTPVVAPATTAAVAPLRSLVDAPRSRVLSRTAFGRLMQLAPWTAKPQPLPAPTADTTPGLETTPPPVGELNNVITPAAL